MALSSELSRASMALQSPAATAFSACRRRMMMALRRASARHHFDRSISETVGSREFNAWGLNTSRAIIAVAVRPIGSRRQKIGTVVALQAIAPPPSTTRKTRTITAAIALSSTTASDRLAAVGLNLPLSFHISIASVVALIIVVPTITLIAAERIHVGFIENDAEQIVVDPLGIAEGMFDDIGLGASPFDHEQE